MTKFDKSYLRYVIPSAVGLAAFAFTANPVAKVVGKISSNLARDVLAGVYLGAVFGVTAATASLAERKVQKIEKDEEEFREWANALDELSTEDEGS